jgi:Na+-driven multidrug efflux pump
MSLKNLKQFLFDFFTKGHKRSLQVKKNIAISFIIKGISIIINLTLIPLTINYVNPTQYGIWLTLSSIISWFSFFDIGFGNGLRNRFAEAKASGNLKTARIYVSTTYLFLIIIFTIVWILFVIGNFFIDWSRILNTPPEMTKELSILAFIVFTFFCLQMVLKTINTILIADQKSAKSAFFDMLGQLIALVIIFILTKTTNGSLINLALVLGLIPIIVFIASSSYFYRTQYRHFAPSYKYIKFSRIKDIMGLGYKFFLIQIAGIILFTTTNILLTQFYGPSEVTSYNIAFKYFSLVSMIFGIILTPFWSAITEAYVKKDFIWIKTTIKKLNTLSFIFILSCIIMTFIANKVFIFWIGPSVKVSTNLSIMMSIYFIISLLASSSNTFINGIGKIQIQFITSIFSIIITIPLSFLFCRYFNFGPAGVIASTLCTTLPCMILYRIQYHKIINGKAKGIWNK